MDQSEGTFVFMEHRGISKHTMELFGVTTQILEGKPHCVVFPYNNDSVKMRSLERKAFKTEGQIQEGGLFGSSLFDSGARDILTITEGEFDALSVAEMLGRKTAAVSVQSGSTALRDCKKAHAWINSFKKIVLCFDNDEQGDKAALAVAPLFDFHKVFRVSMEKYKDANEYLTKGDVDEFVRAWESAKKFTPDSIISSFGDIEKALLKTRDARIGTYPFSQLQRHLFGLHEGELVIIKGLEGIGKTEIFRAMEYHLLKTTNHAIGIVHLEEDNSDTVKAIATYELGLPVALPELGVNEKQIMDAYRLAVGGLEDRLFIHESFDVQGDQGVLDNIRYLSSVCGCKIIFLDHISWLATGMQGEDERLVLDRISQNLKKLAKELRICIICISHVNDDGKTRGSRNITKVANTVIHLVRNVQDSNPEERNRIYLFVEKARLTGTTTGPAGFVVMDRETYRLRDPESSDIVSLPKRKTS